MMDYASQCQSVINTTVKERGQRLILKTSVAALCRNSKNGKSSKTATIHFARSNKPWIIVSFGVLLLVRQHRPPRSMASGLSLRIPRRERRSHEKCYYSLGKSDNFPIFPDSCRFCRTFLGDFDPDGLDSRSLQTPWEWKNRVIQRSSGDATD